MTWKLSIPEDTRLPTSSAWMKSSYRKSALFANYVTEYQIIIECYVIRHVYIGIIFHCIRNSQWCIYNTQSRVLQAVWLILDTNEIANLNNNMPLWCWINCTFAKILHSHLVKLFWYAFAENHDTVTLIITLFNPT